MNAMEAVVFVGLQASGKSTFYGERFFRTHVRINLDMLRTRNRERQLLEACLRTGQPFVVDNTNPTRADRLVYLEAAKTADFRVVGYYFQSSIEACKTRNAQRVDGQRVPLPGLLGTHAPWNCRPSAKDSTSCSTWRFQATVLPLTSGAMKFDDLDAKMRIFETAHDYCVLPGMFMVARLDGRGFTRLTKEIHDFEAPFDVRFRDLMLDTAEYLMTGCGFNFAYGYTESDEISLLFAADERSFGRKVRKLASILAGEASAKFALGLGAQAAFDCRICELPVAGLVVDYFRWRNENAHRNALNAHCYWGLRRKGCNVAQATEALQGLSVAAKNELLFQQGINFNELPAWQKRGFGLIWEDYDHSGVNPKTQARVIVRRRRIRRELELPMKDAYSDFIRGLLSDSPLPAT